MNKFNILAVPVLVLAHAIAVQASPSPAPAPGAVLEYPQSYFADAKLATAYDMVQRLPGFVFDDGNGTRGFSGNAGNVLVNGLRPTSKTDDLQSVLQRIPAEQVARIEIIRGGAPGIDMQNQTVIANVVLKQDDTTSVIATLANSFYGDGHSGPSASVEYNRHSGATIYDATLSRINEEYDDSAGDGYRIVTAPGQPPVQDGARFRGAEKTGYGLNASIATPVWGGNFGANLTLQQTAYNSTVVYDAPSPAAYPSRNGARSAEFGTHWDRQFGALDMNLLALQRLERDQSYNASIAPGDDELFRSVSDTSESILRGTLRYGFSPTLNLEGGLEGDYNTLKGASSYVVNGAAVVLPAANPRVSEQRGDVYAQVNWHVTPDLLAQAGTRFEYSRLSAQGIAPRTLTFPKPRLFVSWSFSPDSQIRLRAERVVGQLDFTNFIASSNLSGNGVSAGAVDLRPDQRWQLEGAYEYHFWNKGAFIFTYLHEDITDLVDYVPVGGGLDGPGNIPKTTNDQYDAEVAVPTDRLGLKNGLFRTSLLWKDSALNDPVTGQPRPITNVWDRTLTFNFTQDIASLDSTWAIGLQLPRSRPQYRIAQVTEIQIRTNYFYLNWEYKPRPDLDLQIGLNNIIPYGLGVTQYNYAGPRNLAGEPTVQEVRIHTEPRVFVQLRKTF